ncbi:LOW QUALITY PROTEIN: uncharacterized protein ACLA_038840 [Aspergillus clavatus NRRL 1]|uniref:Uncharacterized protein n=1 Tax=Aspergillus clavatus (strain ATCC 1007 / CBS 513.65 / DSM 816 / NCTC 3887 / NRRL 1 / QM 1276 / 107) TaxID=344612 RepID=A1CKJ5_ASPCL|nr:LOW QUALITY PROTEIN: uncharacterized protein ACLA_038840 [Aspergillus clavatus NRRL 1]EAW09669.1 hypothetical protein ACLA_038840 [Aspergillus clavatus NRRL 1]
MASQIILSLDPLIKLIQCSVPEGNEGALSGFSALAVGQSAIIETGPKSQLNMASN